MILFIFAYITSTIIERSIIGGIKMKKKAKHLKEGLITKLHNKFIGVTKHKLFKNKLYSSLLMFIGFVTIKILEGDITVFIFTLMLGLPVFFSKKNVIV